MPSPRTRSTLAISMMASEAGSVPVVSMSMTRIKRANPSGDLILPRRRGTRSKAIERTRTLTNSRQTLGQLWSSSGPALGQLWANSGRTLASLGPCPMLGGSALIAASTSAIGQLRPVQRGGFVALRLVGAATLGVLSSTTKGLAHNLMGLRWFAVACQSGLVVIGTRQHPREPLKS